jgi:predicted metal-dependent RNase
MWILILNQLLKSLNSSSLQLLNLFILLENLSNPNVIPKLNSDKYVAHRYQDQDHTQCDIKPGEEPVKIWSLLGLEQVGQCIFIEYKDDIIMIDAGMEFSASETLWADYIVPDICHILRKISRNSKEYFLTHGHLDHIGWLRDILPDLDFPMVYTTPLTLGILKKTFDDPKLAQSN